MIFGSVCSGIEAASVAWHPLGWRAAFLSEIEAFPRSALKARQGAVDARETGAAARGVPLWGDFTTIRPRHLKRLGVQHVIDLLVGGTPCQSFSLAGLRGGMDDERGNLALEYLRLARRLRPRWLVWENVPGVLSSNGGRDFGAILGGMVELGYGIAYRVLDAQYFGVPQRRRRVFVVGYLGDWRRAAAVLFERESLRGDHPPRREAAQGVAGAIARSSFSGGAGGRPEGAAVGHFVAGTLGGTSPKGGWRFGADEAAAGHLIAGTLKAGTPKGDGPGRHDQLVAFGGNRTSGPIDVAAALNAHGGPTGRMDFESETFIASIAPALSRSNPYGDHESREGLLVAHSLRGEGFDASEDGTGRGTPIVPCAYRTAGDGAVYEEGDCTAPLTTGTDSSANIVAFSSKDHGADAGALAPTLRAMGHNSSHPNAGGQIAVSHMAGVRRLTPLECERLQDFPDGYTQVPHRGKPAADGPRYKSLGNSMNTGVMRWLGERIQAVEDLMLDMEVAR